MKTNIIGALKSESNLLFGRISVIPNTELIMAELLKWECDCIFKGVM